MRENLHFLTSESGLPHLMWYFPAPSSGSPAFTSQEARTLVSIELCSSLTANKGFPFPTSSTALGSAFVLDDSSSEWDAIESEMF